MKRQAVIKACTCLLNARNRKSEAPPNAVLMLCICGSPMCTLTLQCSQSALRDESVAPSLCVFMVCAIAGVTRAL